MSRKCKAVETNQCAGSGYIENDRQNLYCTEQCKDSVFQTKMTRNNHISVAYSPSGCTIKPSKFGRCSKYKTCVHYVDCLTLTWNFKSEGFVSDLKGYEKKDLKEITGWNEYGDYTDEYKQH